MFAINEVSSYRGSFLYILHRLAAITGVGNIVLYTEYFVPSEVRNRGSAVIAQFRYIKIQPKTIDLSTRLEGINPTNSVVIPTSLVLRSIVLG